MFSTSDLAALVAIADTGSVRAAAAALGRTQPAITQTIRRLEDAVGFELLDRSSYRARLTPNGTNFVERARLIVNQARSLREFSAMISSGIEPVLRIAIDAAIPRHIWLQLTRGVASKFPDTPVQVVTRQNDGPLRSIEMGAADLAVMFDIAVRHQRTGVDSRPLGSVEFCNAVRADKYRLLRPEGPEIPQVYVTDCESGTVQTNISNQQRYYCVGTHQMQADAIVEGIGWGSVPRWLVADALASKRVVTLPYMGLSESSVYSFSLYRRLDRHTGPAASAVWASAAKSPATAEDFCI